LNNPHPVIARPPGSREARPEDKLHVRAIQFVFVEEENWIARILRKSSGPDNDGGG
jgi:hypothetical protein